MSAPAPTVVSVELADLVLRGVVACPMCSAGRRESVVDGRAISCPWCGERGRVRLERARSLRAQLRSKGERGVAR